MEASDVAGCAALPFHALGCGLWLYLLYEFLARVDASPAMWSAFWAYCVVTVAALTLSVVRHLLEQR